MSVDNKISRQDTFNEKNEVWGKWVNRPNTLHFHGSIEEIIEGKDIERKRNHFIKWKSHMVIFFAFLFQQGKSLNFENNVLNSRNKVEHIYLALIYFLSTFSPSIHTVVYNQLKGGHYINGSPPKVINWL